MTFSTKTFLAAIPRIDERLNELNRGVRVENAKLDRGTLRPWRAPLQVGTTAKPGTIQSIYRFAPVAGNAASGFWFHWAADVDVMRGPVDSDTMERTYFTGDGIPKMTYAGIATAGGGDTYPTNSRPLGIPVPGSRPVAILGGSAGSDVDPLEDIVQRSYVFTFVSSLGEEGPPSDPSDVLDWLPGMWASMTLPGAPPEGGYDVTQVAVYRLATGAGGSDYFHLVTLPIATTGYVDYLGDESLGDPLESLDWYMPPADMRGIGVLPSGMAYGFSKNQVCLSEPYRPHAWSPEVRLNTSHPIVAMGHFGDTIVAVTERNPYVITGIDPRSMSIDEYTINQGCVAKRSLIKTPMGVVYASPDGLVMIGKNGYVNLTDKLFTLEQWRELKPETIMSAFYERYYLGFYNDGSGQKCFVIDLISPEMGVVVCSVTATAVYHDALADTLFLSQGSNLFAWDKGALLPVLWRSPVVVTSMPYMLTVARVLATSYDDVEFRLYADGSLLSTVAVKDATGFRVCATNKKYKKFQWEVAGTAEIKQVDVASALEGLRVP